MSVPLLLPVEPGGETVLEVLKVLSRHQWWEDAREQITYRFIDREWDFELKRSVPKPPRFATYADCSDTFFWGSADAEEVTFENTPIFEGVLEEVRVPREAAYAAYMERADERAAAYATAHRLWEKRHGAEPYRESPEFKEAQAADQMTFLKWDNVVTDLFAARVRHLRPQGAAYKVRYPEEAWVWFDAAGPERTVGLGNPKEPGQ